MQPQPCDASRARGGKNVGDVAIAVAEYVDWSNQRRLQRGIGRVSPAEFATSRWSTINTSHCRQARSRLRVSSNRASRKVRAIPLDIATKGFDHGWIAGDAHRCDH